MASISISYSACYKHFCFFAVQNALQRWGKSYGNSCYTGYFICTCLFDCVLLKVMCDQLLAYNFCHSLTIWIMYLNNICQTSGLSVLCVLWLASQTQDSICYSPPSMVLDFTQEFSPHFSEERNYFVLAIHWFGIY